MENRDINEFLMGMHGTPEEMQELLEEAAQDAKILDMKKYRRDLALKQQYSPQPNDTKKAEILYFPEKKSTKP